MKKGIKITLISFGATLLTLTAALFTFTGIALPTMNKSVAVDSSHFLRDCVAENEALKDVPLTELSLLGSHDALSNDISYTSKPNRNEDNIVNNDVLSYLAKGMMVRLSRAQNEDAYAQLTHGVRYMDVRITYLDGVYYNMHGLISNTFEHNLKLILQFLYENPGEFVLLGINKYYAGTSDDYQLEEFIKSVTYENTNLFDYVNYSSDITSFKELTYRNLTSDGTKAGVVIWDEDSSNPTFNHFSGQIYSHWNNQMNNDKIVACIRETAKKGKQMGSDYLRINQTQQTPSFKSVGDVMYNWSLLHLAEIHNDEMMGLTDIEEILDGLPIYMCDYASENQNGFNTRLLSLLKKRNTQLF